MTGTWGFAALILSFTVTWALGKWLVPYLHRLKYGQTILQIGPSWHKGKQGTPTMGGIMFIVGILLAVVVCLPLYYAAVASDTRRAETPIMIIKIISGLMMALSYGLVGFVDDYIKIVKKRNLGLTAPQKLFLQFSIAIMYLASVYFVNYSHKGSSYTSTLIPFIGRINLGVFYWPIAAIVIVGMVNAVNLTDGIDGLNTLVTLFVGAFFMVACPVLHMVGLSIVSVALVGGCLGFLIWNFHPAKVFMGDTGSLFLGGIICALSFGMDMPILLPVVGIVYIMEMFSVMVQVIYFKFTHGKRIFKMTPIHHHFEMSGWSEVKICTVAALATVIASSVAVLAIRFGL